MNQPTVDAMSQRVIRLERDVRRGKMLGGVLLLLLGLTVVLGATRSQERTIAEEIWAQRFVLADKTGKILGLLSAGSSDVGLSLVDPAGKTRLMMTVGADGEPTIVLTSARQKHRVTVASGSIFVGDEEGRTRFSFGVGKEGRPIAMLWDRADRVRMTLALVGEGEEPGIRFADKANKTTWQVP